MNKLTENIGEKTRIGIYWRLLSKASYEILRFGISIIVARILDPRDFGIIAIASIIIYYANTITNLGFNQALVQRQKINDEHINSVFTLDLVISALLTFILFFSASAIARFFNAPESKSVIRVLSLVFVLTTFHDMPYTLFRRNIDFKLISLVDFIRGCFSSALALLLAILGFKYWALVWGQLIPLFGATAYLLYKVEWIPKITYNHGLLKGIYSFGFWNFLRAQVVCFANSIDRIIIGRVLSPVALGFYDKSATFCEMPLQSISSNVNTVLYSSFSRGQMSKEYIRQLLKKGILIISLINFPIYAGIYAIAPYFVIVLLGEKWRPMIIPLQIFALSGFFASFSGLFASLNIALGSYRPHTIRLIIATILYFISILLLVQIGIEGVALGMLGYRALFLGLSFALVKKISCLGWSSLASCIFPAFLCSLSMLVIVKICSFVYFVEYSLLNLFSLVMIGFVCYVIFMFIYPLSLLHDIRASLYRDCTSVWSRIKNNQVYRQSR